MADKVGQKTGKKTAAGRDVYLTDTGEQVSEKSVTIKFGEGAYVNAPSIHDGIEYNEDEIKKMLLDGKIKPTSRHDTLEEAIKAAKNRSKNLLNEGGMAKQMELFDEGGLLDEGGTTDPVSGNDVPTGSLQKEVRDDIPAQLSEGEFVMPADVVRYHGLDKMMALRDEAKMGLQRMEAMGQMGNADEAIIPDGVPFTLIDLEIVDDEDEPMEMQVGGFVPGIPQQPPYGVVQQPPGQNIYSVPSQFQQPVAIPFQQPYFTPTQSPVMPVFGPGQPTGEPKETFTFDEMMPTVGGTSETREYRNAAGESLYIPFINGEPIYPIPEGYFPYTPEAAPDPTPDPVTTTGQTVREEDPSDGREFGGGPAGLSREESKIAVLTQLDNALPPEQRTGFGQKITGIKDKYKAPAGLAGFSIIGGVGRAFKERGEINKALKDFDYDAAAAATGLTREEYDGVINELTGEVYSGYRDPETGEVSGQKDSRNPLQRIGDFLGGSGKEEDFGDEFGNIAPDGTMPTTTRVETTTSANDGKPVLSSASTRALSNSIMFSEDTFGNFVPKIA